MAGLRGNIVALKEIEENPGDAAVTQQVLSRLLCRSAVFAAVYIALFAIELSPASTYHHFLGGRLLYEAINALLIALMVLDVATLAGLKWVGSTAAAAVCLASNAATALLYLAREAVVVGSRLQSHAARPATLVLSLLLCALIVASKVLTVALVHRIFTNIRSGALCMHPLPEARVLPVTATPV